MKLWILKAIIQKLISWLPFSHKINFLFQKYVTKGVILNDDLFIDKLTHLREHLNAFAQYGDASSPDKKRAYELGTGWYPIIPIGLFLTGFEEIVTVDISPLLKKKQILDAIRHFIRFQNEGKLHDYIYDIKEERLNTLRDLASHGTLKTRDEILRTLKIESLVTDARKLPFENNAFDLITSNNTFEHIPGGILTEILTEMKRVLKSTGVMCHFIDMSDHFAHLDKSISIYNYLKFSDKKWKRIDNSVQPQNRLRLPQYLEIFENVSIPVTEIKSRPGNIEELERIKLDVEFQKYPLTEVAVSHTLIISQKT